MRHPLFTLLSLAALVIAAGGCRQTNGTTGPLPTMGGLSPVAPGQTPALGSFGSTTRVTPPPTGSFSPNGNLGTSAPAPGYGPTTNFAPQPNSGAFNQPVGSGWQGSGVQPVSGFDQPAINQHATWTETGTTIPAGGSNQGRDPRAGGMQVNDLTAPTNPPNFQTGNFQAPQASNTASLVISPNLLPPQPAIQQPALQQPALQPAQQNFQNVQPNFQPIQQHAPSAFQAQSSPQFPSTRPQFETRTNPSPLPSASTATLPTQQNDGALNWRRPGTQF